MSGVEAVYMALQRGMHARMCTHAHTCLTDKRAVKDGREFCAEWSPIIWLKCFLEKRIPALRASTRPARLPWGAEGHVSHKCLAPLLNCTGACCHSLFGCQSSQLDETSFSCLWSVATFCPLIINNSTTGRFARDDSWMRGYLSWLHSAQRLEPQRTGKAMCFARWRGVPV